MTHARRASAFAISTRFLALIATVFTFLALAATPVLAADTTCNGLAPTVTSPDPETGEYWGTRGPDVILGSPGNDIIRGFRGDDVICGLGGADVIYGGPGNDWLHGGVGWDKIYGTGGDDLVYGGAGKDRLQGGPGNDIVVGGGDDDTLRGGDDDDVLIGEGGADALVGGTGNDVLEGDDGPDFLLGGLGDDSMEGGGGDDEMWGRAGADVLLGGGDADTLRAGGGVDECAGESLAGCEIAEVAPGDAGSHVAYLQGQLSDALLYRGPSDGVYPNNARDLPGQMMSAVYAFHKFYRAPEGAAWSPDDHVSAVWTIEDWERFFDFTPAAPVDRPGEPDRIEVDATRNLMWLIRGGEVTGIFHVSIGGEYLYKLNGETRLAHTPRGDWDFDRFSYGKKVAGYQYKSWYFEQNYFAVHGFYKVPPWPVSHGCVRVTYDDADWLQYRIYADMPIHVWDR